MTPDRVRSQLRAACLSGDLQQAEALLQPSQASCSGLWCLQSGSPTSSLNPLPLLCAPFPADGNNTILHYVAAGRGLSTVGRLLWTASGGVGQVQPGRYDEQRARLLAWLLQCWPGLLALLCSRNAAGLTPLHCCLNSASVETLQALMRGVGQLSAGSRRVVLGMPFPDGRPPLALVLDRREWEAVQLLVQAGGHLLTHDLLSAWQQVVVLLSPQAAAPSSKPGARAGGGSGGLKHAVAGVVRSAVGQLVGLVVGQAQEEQAVQEWRRRQQQQAQQARQGAGPAAGSSSGMAGDENASTVGSPRGSASAAAAAQAGVAVLRGTADLQRLREEQIARTADVLGVSAPEAAALLAAKSWDELAVMQSHLGAGRGEEAWGGGGHGEPAAAVAVAMEPTPPGQGSSSTEKPARSSSSSNGHPAPSRPTAPTGVGLAAVMDLAWSGGVEAAEAAGSIAAASRRQHPLLGSGTILATGQPLSSPSNNSSSEQSGRQCIICYEDCRTNGEPGLDLPCRHPVCRSCWKGILMAQLDTGEVQRVVCPEPGCGLPLPVAAAEALLPPRDYQRYSQLLAQSFVASNPTLRWCPRPGCGNVVRLLAHQGTAGTELRDAAAAGRGVNVQCGCGHAFCWACSGDPHEPATCEQMRRWGGELAALRQAAPGQDQEWLARNTKRCPSCGMAIEKHGGCEHMTCRSCRHEWCWTCGRAWAQHSAETGGYYYCNLETRADLPDFAQPAAVGPLGWLRDAWGALQNMATQRALQQQLRLFLQHDFNPAILTTLAIHVQRLLQAAGAGGPPGQEHGRGHASGGVGMYSGRLGPDTLLGLSLGEAIGMGSVEWGQLVTAAADSLACSGQLSTAAAAEGLGAAAVPRGEGRSRDGKGSGPSGSAPSPSSAGPVHNMGAEMARLAQAVAAAHRCLQHAAVAAWALGGFGPRRRYLDGLCGALEASVSRLEGLLMALPDREAALQCQQHHFRAPSAWAEGGRRVSSLFGRMLHSLYGVRPSHLRPSKLTISEQAQPAGCFKAQADGPQQSRQQVQQTLPREQLWVQGCLSAGLSGEQLRRQLFFALAVQGQGQRIDAELAALEAVMQELQRAGRAGLFCPA